MLSKEINKDNINFYLNEFAKEFKKLSKRKGKIEIIIIGGGSALINYGFRNSTYDIDAIMYEKTISKEALNKVADKYGLPYDWLNNDFEKSSSYSDKLILYSTYYKTFCNCVDVRIVKGEYLLTMKLKSGRIYKHDLSDITGIILFEKKLGNEITFERIIETYEELYGNINQVDERILRDVEIQTRMDVEELEEKYNLLCDYEAGNKELLMEFKDIYHIRLYGDRINQTIEEYKQSKLKDN